MVKRTKAFYIKINKEEGSGGGEGQGWRETKLTYDVVGHIWRFVSKYHHFIGIRHESCSFLFNKSLDVPTIMITIIKMKSLSITGVVLYLGVIFIIPRFKWIAYKMKALHYVNGIRDIHHTFLSCQPPRINKNGKKSVYKAYR